MYTHNKKGALVQMFEPVVHLVNNLHCSAPASTFKLKETPKTNQTVTISLSIYGRVSNRVTDEVCTTSLLKFILSLFLFYIGIR